MPLPPPAPRDRHHTRRITAQGFRRHDGLWDIEAELNDVKDVAYENMEKGVLPPGELLHGMSVRVTVDENFLIHDAAASTDHSPFAVCAAAAPGFARLTGMRLGSDFLEVVEDMFGGPKGCTHLNELMAVVLTTAYQTLWSVREAKEASRADRKKPSIIDRCHALKGDGNVVALHWPQYARKPGSKP
ncbi:MAG: DUF2889 domain-containing protein [Alphaproteobacteria bacterium]|nr:DUF2889 domain-containing protein [Alphaproteobacteria bacterium]